MTKYPSKLTLEFSPIESLTVQPFDWVDIYMNKNSPDVISDDTHYHYIRYYLGINTYKSLYLFRNDDYSFNIVVLWVF